MMEGQDRPDSRGLPPDFGRDSDKEIRGPEVDMAMWLAIQELKRQNDELRSRVAELEASR